MFTVSHKEVKLLGPCAFAVVNLYDVSKLIRFRNRKERTYLTEGYIYSDCILRLENLSEIVQTTSTTASGL